ncbi:tetratricopeptide repeat protein [Dactylosporangium roseum]|uniref:Tetratricopeptide repeat protein n=1 Tax=Dactylosporangium roseum TaxID=47989 RepID=A0ABY5Z8Z3_9ACTN|nr:tetratricopeptide repeat protein [Dactylosporangium roseum]UWZ38558.1 tetratricopeptide repeat protein [Dactylosporangium roseum]
MSSYAQLANAVQGARAVATQGDVRGAFALLGRALDAATTTLGHDDPDVLSATGLLARFHADLGELADARRLLEEGLAAGHHRLGDGHPVMLDLAYELARVADELGNVYEAKRRYGQLARFGPQALGEDHPGVRAARRYLGLDDDAGTGATVRIPHVPPPATFDPVSPPPAAASGPAPARGGGERAGAVGDAGRFDREAWRQDEPGVFERVDQASGRAPGPVPAPPRSETEASAPARQEAPQEMPAWQETPAWAGAQASGPPWPSGRANEPIAQPVPPAATGTGPRRRSPLVALLVILVVAVLGGVTAATVSFLVARRDDAAQPRRPVTSQASAPSSAPASSAGAPGNPKAPGSLKLRDDRTSITLTWVDPSKGSVPFIVAGGQQGSLRQLQVLAAGSTTYTINGLNPKLDYCFTVAAVYDTNSVELSDLTCTKRA